MNDSNEYETQNDGELMVASGNGLPPIELPVDYGYEDDDLDGAELEEDALYEPAPAAPLVSDADQARMEARLEQLEGYRREREASRVHPKVVAGSGAAAVAAAVTTALPMMEDLNLSDGAQTAVTVVIVLIATFFGGYVKSGRPPVEV